MEMDVLKSKRNVSVPERILLDTIIELRFGEIYGVRMEVSPYIELRELTEEEWRLISFLRAGEQYVDILQVHMGGPSMALQDIKLNGYRCQKKTRFSA